ncbi:DUF2024 family protein [Maribacter algicola]|uniref:DUF2024 family protein n=1 Tax=Meishania litoralis TaxID=3434685 RepID=A0ACC7LPC1_9FLAO
MKVSVWDTYVEREDAKVMHFDILVPNQVTDEETILDFGKQFLKTKPFGTKHLTARECRFCHIEEATEQIISSIQNVGFHIIEMENCN